MGARLTSGLWHRETAAAVLLATVLPVALMWLWFGGLAAAGRLVFVLIVAGIWHLGFMLARAQAPSLAGAYAALFIAMLAPTGLGPIQLILGISFGVVMAELVFGGWGRNILNPATVTLAFLGFGFPAAPWPELALPVGWAVLPAAVMGIVFGILSWRLLAGAGLVFGLAHVAGMGLTGGAWIAIAVVLVALVAEPVSAATTSLGRWLNGGLYALLALIFAAVWQDAAPVQLAVSAALLASLTAPLLDEIALTIWHWRRRNLLG